MTRSFFSSEITQWLKFVLEVSDHADRILFRLTELSGFIVGILLFFLSNIDAVVTKYTNSAYLFTIYRVYISWLALFCAFFFEMYNVSKHLMGRIFQYMFYIWASSTNVC
jgi:hypothetical protein